MTPQEERERVGRLIASVCFVAMMAGFIVSVIVRGSFLLSWIAFIVGCFMAYFGMMILRESKVPL